MKLKHILLFFGILIFNLVLSQDKIETSIQYKLEYKTDSLANNYEVENFILLANKEKAYFLSTVSYVKDSLLVKSNNEITEEIRNLYTPNDYYILLEPSKTLVQHFQPTNSTKIFYDSNPKFNWVLKNETKLIHGIKCRKAITKQFGRKWEAWYTEEYPFPVGPYKFFGLPGLILKINDTKKYYNFEAFRIKKYKNKTFSLNTSQYLKTDAKKFWEVYNKDKYSLDPIFDTMEFEDESVKPTMKKNLQNQHKKDNNPLELTH